MKQGSPGRKDNPGQEGFALLLLMCLLALVVLATTMIAPTVIASIQRDKEQEMIWRGNQYARGVKLFYQKMHRFPQSLDDLTKPQIGMRFMRQPYKDPMNMPDGSWRLIYVGPNGQLIGSTKNRMISMNGQPAQMLGAAAGAAGAFGSQSIFASSKTTNPPGTASDTQTSDTTGNTGTSSTANPDNANPDTPSDATGTLSPIMGGNIIGVGSKARGKSFHWYEKAKNYHDFEFIWDPSKDILAGTGIPQGPGLGTTPIGPAPGVTAPNPQPNPGPTPNSGMGQSPGPDSGPPLQAPPN